jgi:hypothetical protein
MGRSFGESFFEGIFLRKSQEAVGDFLHPNEHICPRVVGGNPIDLAGPFFPPSYDFSSGRFLRPHPRDRGL